MTLREQTALTDLLHGRWRGETTYAYIRLHGAGSMDANGRIIQPVDVLDHSSDGLWLPKVEPVDDDGNPMPFEVRCYRTSLGDLEAPIMDHPGGVSSWIYRIGTRERTYKARDGTKKKAKEFIITDRWETAQRSLPPPTSGQSAPGPAPPAGGGPTVTPPDGGLIASGMHPQPAPTAAGPLSPPGQGVGNSATLPTPSPGNAQGEAAEGLCACGREAVAMQFQMGPNKGQVWCTRCGRRVA